jgi:hypothetical protein
MILSPPIRYKINTGLRKVGIELRRAEDRANVNFPGYVEQEFRDLYAKYYNYTMVPWHGLYTTYKAAHHVIKAGISGDIVECGVWKGGCTAIMMEVFKNAGQGGRQFWLYDTFEGMTTPSDSDVHFAGNKNAVKLFSDKKKKGEKWSFSPLEECKQTIKLSDYPSENIKFIKGDVLETLPNEKPQSIALLRLDTDWYESTLAEMEHLYPLIRKGGVFISDDYGAWKGSYDAIHEYLKLNNINNLFMHIDTSYGGVSAIKP